MNLRKYFYRKVVRLKAVVNRFTLTLIKVPLLQLYAEFNHFIHHKIELLDGIVVFVSFSLDVFTAFVHDKNLIGIVGGLLIFRFWRIVRIINGMHLLSN